MHTQYLADHALCERSFATLESQNLPTDLSTYPALSHLVKMPLGRTSVLSTSIAGKMAGFKNRPRITSDRRYRCQRTSSFWQHSALWSSLPPVRASSRSKNLSLLTQPRFRLSQYTPANTSNTLTRWALSPASTTPQTDGHLAGEAASC